MNIIERALDMLKAVQSFAEKAKKLFYSVMLLGHRCPECNGLLVMVAEGKCRCGSCGDQFDPTVAFQKCTSCGGTAALKVRRYRCSKCGSDIPSRFLFDGLVFDVTYFRHKMAESRQCKKEQKESIRQMLAESRSGELPLGQADLGTIPGLLDALNALTEGFHEEFAAESRDEFNLKRYEMHIQAHIQDFPISLEEIPPLSEENARKDRIWRFIATIFLAHAGVIDIWQEGQEIMVRRHEAYREGQKFFGELGESDGIEGPVGGIET